MGAALGASGRRRLGSHGKLCFRYGFFFSVPSTPRSCGGSRGDYASDPPLESTPLGPQSPSSQLQGLRTSRKRKEMGVLCCRRTGGLWVGQCQVRGRRSPSTSGSHRDIRGSVSPTNSVQSPGLSMVSMHSAHSGRWTREASD